MVTVQILSNSGNIIAIAEMEYDDYYGEKGEKLRTLCHQKKFGFRSTIPYTYEGIIKFLKEC